MDNIKYSEVSTNYETAVVILQAVRSMTQDLIHCFMGSDVQSEYLMIRVQDLQHITSMLENVITHNESMKTKMQLTLFKRPPDTGPVERTVENGKTKNPH